MEGSIGLNSETDQKLTKVEDVRFAIQERGNHFDPGGKELVIDSSPDPERAHKDTDPDFQRTRVVDGG